MEFNKQVVHISLPKMDKMMLINILEMIIIRPINLVNFRKDRNYTTLPNLYNTSTQNLQHLNHKYDHRKILQFKFHLPMEETLTNLLHFL